jgi:hypothetical protein
MLAYFEDTGKRERGRDVTYYELCDRIIRIYATTTSGVYTISYSVLFGTR